jgi:hypothetical protein
MPQLTFTAAAATDQLNIVAHGLNTGDGPGGVYGQRRRTSRRASPRASTTGSSASTRTREARDVERERARERRDQHHRRWCGLAGHRAPPFRQERDLDDFHQIIAVGIAAVRSQTFPPSGSMPGPSSAITSTSARWVADDPTNPKQRAGSMSGEDRALAGHKERVAARAAQAAPRTVEDEDSLPIIADGPDGDDTPLDSPDGRRRKRQSVQAFAEDIKLEVRDLRTAIDVSIRAELNGRGELAERLVKVEASLDFLKELDDSNSAAEELLKLRADLTSLRVTLIGEKRRQRQDQQVRDEATKGPRFMKRAIAIASPASSAPSSRPPRSFATSPPTAAAERARVRAELEAAKAERTVLQSQVLLLFRLEGGRAGRGGAFDHPPETPP